MNALDGFKVVTLSTGKKIAYKLFIRQTSKGDVGWSRHIFHVPSKLPEHEQGDFVDEKAYGSSPLTHLELEWKQTQGGKPIFEDDGSLKVVVSLFGEDIPFGGSVYTAVITSTSSSDGSREFSLVVSDEISGGVPTSNSSWTVNAHLSRYIYEVATEIFSR